MGSSPTTHCALDATPEKRNLLCQLCAEAQCLRRSGEDPFVAARMIGTEVLRAHPSTSTSGPDREVGARRRVAAPSGSSTSAFRVKPGLRRRDVARGVLVEERVEEASRPADRHARSRRRARPRRASGAVVVSELRAQFHVFALRRSLSLTRPPSKAATSRCRTSSRLLPVPAVRVDRTVLWCAAHQAR